MKKKIVAMCATVAIAALAVGGTLAYFTDTDVANNTFTVGDIEIILDEAPVDENGKAIEDAKQRVQENEYKLFPGGKYDKDPMVTVKANSEECYVRMLVTADVDALKKAFPADKYAKFYNGNMFLLQELVGGWDAAKWPCYKVDGDQYEFRYYKTVNTLAAEGAEAKDLALEPLFKTVVIPGSVEDETLAELDDLKINIVAQAIQADGFDTADLAWAEWK